MTQPLDINKLARKAVETDIQQYFTDCLTPDRKYETPIDNVLSLITKLAAEKDAEIARHKTALNAATDALKTLEFEVGGRLPADSSDSVEPASEAGPNWIYDAIKELQTERDRLMADVVQYRMALETLIAQCDKTDWMGVAGEMDAELDAAKAALAAEHPGAPFVAAVGKAYEYLDRIHKGDPVPADMLANNAKACLKPFLPLDGIG